MINAYQVVFSVRTAYGVSRRSLNVLANVSGDCREVVRSLEPSAVILSVTLLNLDCL